MQRLCYGNETEPGRENDPGWDDDANPITCPSHMVYSKCISACTKRTCSDLTSEIPLQLWEKCIPGCLCPEGTIEQKGKCVESSACECMDTSGRTWSPGASWIVKGGACSICRCTDGEVVCQEISKIFKSFWIPNLKGNHKNLKEIFLYNTANRLWFNWNMFL